MDVRELWRKVYVPAVGTFAAGVLLDVVGLTDVWSIPHADAPESWHLAPLAAGCLAMLGSRRRPMAALAAGTGAFAVDLVLGGSIAFILVMFDLLFSVGRFASPRARAAVTTAVFVLVGTASVVGGLAAGQVRIGVFICLQLTSVLFVPLWWAANIRQQQQIGALDAERIAREAVVAERAAMARDLHDVIAAHLATTAMHSGAALAAPPETGRDRAALQAVRTSSLEALEEMRSMILLLRADAAPADRSPVLPGGLDRLPDLVSAATAAGLHVEVSAGGVPAVPVVVAHTVYGIVREALTNAGKHAPGSDVTLDVRQAGARITVTVTNTLTTTDLDHPALSAGTGLWSIRERAALLGGDLTATRDGNRWRVHASLPLPTA
ncbi:two-component sensor histidine kinase [Actinoplanes philippinensis]|uniref:sensor histidine kinase n=1 Tax=Actinoplanes philippinensis TaxID=35752 RepID=UPI000B82E9C4|nr:histidine kinase [Actinoplanes philippinensis]GIE82211.1 two-component sensor histidine kinase [Actinoplanes philippinensis]